MLWLIFAALTALFHALTDVFSKKSLKNLDEYTVSMAVSLFSLPILLIMLYFSPIPEVKPDFWLALFGSGILNILALILYLKALKSSDLSISVPMLTFTPLFLLITSPIMLGEFPSALGLVGVLLIVIGSYVLNIGQRNKGIIEPFKALLKETGPRLVLIVAFIYSISSNFDKIGVVNSSPIFWSVALNAFVFLGLLPVVLYRSKGFLGAVKTNSKFIVPVGIFHALMVFAQTTALSLTLVAYVISIKRAGVLISILFGYFIFKEKNIKERLLGAAIMVLGVILIAFS